MLCYLSQWKRTQNNNTHATQVIFLWATPGPLLELLPVRPLDEWIRNFARFPPRVRLLCPFPRARSSRILDASTPVPRGGGFPSAVVHSLSPPAVAASTPRPCAPPRARPCASPCAPLGACLCVEERGRKVWPNDEWVPHIIVCWYGFEGLCFGVLLEYK